MSKKTYIFAYELHGGRSALLRLQDFLKNNKFRTKGEIYDFIDFITKLPTKAFEDFLYGTLDEIWQTPEKKFFIKNKNN